MKRHEILKKNLALYDNPNWKQFIGYVVGISNAFQGQEDEKRGFRFSSLLKVRKNERISIAIAKSSCFPP